MYHFCLVMFVLISVVLIILIMWQQNSSGGAGSILDNRVLSNMLNSRSYSDNITRAIVILAVLFFLLSLILGNMNCKFNKVYSQNNNQKVAQDK